MKFPRRAPPIQWKWLGPGLLTGASDDDPSGIATYAQVGARFGFTFLWTMPFTYPLMGVVQEMCARVGRVTGRGIAGNLRRHAPRWVVFTLVGLMVVANVVNLGADISGMGAAVQLLVGGPALVYAVVLTLLSLGLQVVMPYTRYVRVLKWLCLALLAYVLTVFAVRVPWSEALKSTFLPRPALDRHFMVALTAVLGTTISPYLFFWQASEEAEEQEDDPAQRPLVDAPLQAPAALRRIRFDTFTGMAVSNVVAWFIILTTAATLHAHGAHGIQSAADAAKALEPLAGRYASLLFSLGIVGTGLLAIPVLAGSAAYAIGEAMHWPVGLERKPKDAVAFYTVLALAVLLGLAMNLLRLDPIRALFLSAVVNGVLASPLMVAILLLSNSRRVMGEFRPSRAMLAVGWAATAVMAFVAVAGFVAGGGNPGAP
jgi:NRAMP (natural resistance-associated macrophage protein)-like metal ion transporter